MKWNERLKVENFKSKELLIIDLFINFFFRMLHHNLLKVLDGTIFIGPATFKIFLPECPGHCIKIYSLYSKGLYISDDVIKTCQVT